MTEFNFVIDFEEKASPEIGMIAVKGEKGDRGLDGEPGPGITGISQNQDGTLTIHIADGTSYDTQPLKGADGEPGAKGDKGDKGDTGEKGEDGLPGADGKDGAKGEKGDKGDKGDTGATGAKGDKGDPGKDGADGLPGAKGDKGDKGDDGYTPIKGTDYWTASDKAGIVSDTMSELDYIVNVTMTSEAGGTIDKTAAEIAVAYSANKNVMFVGYLGSVHFAAPVNTVYRAESGGVEVVAIQANAVVMGTDGNSLVTLVVPFNVGDSTTVELHQDKLGQGGETVNVSGTTPTITAETNTRYICGEVLSLSFTPCATGICDVRFTSGSTATVLTLPNTVKMPEWWDGTCEPNTVYEINILDGVYGAVMAWEA